MKARGVEGLVPSGLRAGPRSFWLSAAVVGCNVEQTKIELIEPSGIVTPLSRKLDFRIRDCAATPGICAFTEIAFRETLARRTLTARGKM